MQSAYILPRAKTAIFIIAIFSVLLTVAFFNISISKADNVDASPVDVVAPTLPVPSPEPSILDLSAGSVDPGQVGTTPEIIPTEAPVLSTDKLDYHPGETATIWGNLFGVLQNIVLKIFGVDENNNQYTEEVQNLTADASGSFTTTYTLDGVFRPLYNVVASALDGTQLAATSFTDGNVKTHSGAGGTTFTLTRTTYTNTTCTGSIDSGPTVVTGVGFSGGSIDTVGVGNMKSAKLVAAVTSDQSGAFINWTTSDGGMIPSSPAAITTVCVVGFGGNGSRDYFANYGASTGHIIIVKDSVPNDAQDFSFTNNFANGNPSPLVWTTMLTELFPTRAIQS